MPDPTPPPRPEPDREGLRRLLSLGQDGIVTRRQLEELDFLPHDVQRMVRRKELVRVHDGVFVDHTGPLSWEQRTWVAVFATGGALTRESALPRPVRTGAVHVAVDARRTVSAPSGVVVHRTARLAERLHPTAVPLQVRVEHAVVDVADDAPDYGAAFMVLADACHGRRTNPAALREVVRGRRRLQRRAILLGALDDLEQGACSVLEQAYLHRVERAHGLPEGRRQSRDELRGDVVRRDVEYEPWGVVVELDGRTHHDSPRARDRDMRRDLAAAADRDVLTARVGHAQVLGEACQVAVDVAALLRRRGWSGEPTRCSSCQPAPGTGA